MNLVNCFKISYLIIPSHPLHPSPACTWTWSIVLRSLIWSSIPSSSSVSRMYVNLVNCFKISYLIIPSHPLHPSPDRTWTWSNVLRSLIWSSHPILFIRLQGVRELRQLFLDISSDHPILFVDLQRARHGELVVGMIYTRVTIKNLIFDSIILFPSCMSFLRFLPLFFNCRFILCSYRKKRWMQKPIGVGVLQLSTIILTWWIHARQLRRFLNISMEKLIICNVSRSAMIFPILFEF